MDLKKTSFMFMRTNPVDLSRYLPTFPYNDKTFSAIQATLNLEHENYRLKMIEVARQFFYQTANQEGLIDWARYLKIPRYDRYDTDTLRKLIGVKLLRNDVATLDNTKKLLRELMPYGEPDIEELGDNRLRLILNNGNFLDWDETLTALYDFLPAHLIFSFGIYFDEGEEKISYAQATADATAETFDMELESPPPLIITPANFAFDLSCDEFNLGLMELPVQVLSIGLLRQEYEHVKIQCASSDLGDDEETLIDFERYLRQRWSEFKDNPVVHWYRGVDDGELEPDDTETFPINQDFLRLYWKFDCEDDSKWHLRYQTIMNPRENLQASEINQLSEIGKSSGMLLHSKLQKPTTGILRALYIHKETIKVL